ncbi:uncharacterized protein LOC119111004 [Pollicipes pollicipes]|uniref:uncharacterized protein LOC119111004 n=1 Tax=Pollicipes pollicipes TaxID=41117 RepID=UPI001884E607|nr:uncharacterized protein LOC119111004 [Pollicipes pollicipes]
MTRLGLRWTLLVAVFIKAVAAQRADDQSGPTVTDIDVQCERTGMRVEIQFSERFDGIIFSKGHFADPSCRYVPFQSGDTSYTFEIPMTGCGSRAITDDGRMGFENTMIIQSEEVVQEQWDSARRLSCDWPDRVEKLVTFRPIAVQMLDATEARFAGDDVTCWMDIQLGRGPFAESVDGIVRIGDELTVVLMAQAAAGQMDMAVKNCYAYDGENISDPRTTVLQLTDDNGCLLKPKLMGYFRKTRQTGSTGADILAFARMNAFKFPDRMDVYLACEVEFCKGRCEQGCDSDDAPRGFQEDGDRGEEDEQRNHRWDLWNHRRDYRRNQRPDHRRNHCGDHRRDHRWNHRRDYRWDHRREQRPDHRRDHRRNHRYLGA